MGLIDRAIEAVSPSWHARRSFARAQVAAAGELTAHYEGATRAARAGGWSPIGSSANTAIATALPALREAARNLRRNNSLAENCISVLGDHMVGAGIELSFDCPRKRVKARLCSLVKKHLETTAIDYDGRNNYAGLQRLAATTMADAGEALIVRYVPPSMLRLPVPLQVRVLDPDFLDASKSGPIGGGNYCYEGIEVDSTGRRVAYWLFDEHPGGGLTYKLPVSRRVNAANVRHVYRQDRPGQMRGVPWGASVIVELGDLRDVKRAELMRYKIAACFAVFFKGITADTNIGQKVGRAIDAAKSAIGNLIEKLQPGLIQKLPPGVEPVMATPPSVSGFKDFVSVHEHSVSAGFGVPHMLATGVMSEVSFISGRLGLLQFNRRVDVWRWTIIIPHVCAPIVEWFIDAATVVVGAGDLSDVTAKHTPPRREMLEPSKEVPAMRESIRAGLSSRQAEVRSLGEDPERIDAEQAEDNKRSDKLGLGYDSDGRKPLNGKTEKADA